jgi:DNA-binding transcriptional LysR family regulator
MPMNPWLGVEFRHLAALDAISRTGSFRGAADALGYVQSAVSQQVARLEALVGLRLIDRGRGTGPVELTAAGKLMLEHTNAIMQRFEAAQADLQAVNEGRAGMLRVGTSDTVARSLVPAVLSACAQRTEMKVVPVEVVAENDVFTRVTSGELDVAFANLPLEIGPFAYVEVCVDPCVLVVPADSPLAARIDPVPAVELASIPLIRQTRWRMMPLVEAQLRAAGVEPKFVVHVGTSATAQALVGAELGSAILPRLAVDALDPRVAVLNLTGLLPYARIAAFWHTDREGLAGLDEFLAVALTVARGLAEADDRPRPALAA